MYRYFVSYSWAESNGKNGFGVTETRAPFEIKGQDEVILIQESIEKENDFQKGSVIILNFKLLQSKKFWNRRIEMNIPVFVMLIWFALLGVYQVWF